jgi:hypothetical protein
MEIQQAAVALLAALVLVLGGIVGWLYWQQQRLFQNMNAIVGAIGELASRPAIPITFPEPEPEPEPEAESPPDEEDDRVSVDELPDVQLVSGPPEALDTDGLESKSKKELQDILSKRGIPFGKADTKTALISLLKATA